MDGRTHPLIEMRGPILTGDDGVFFPRDMDFLMHDIKWMLIKIKCQFHEDNHIQCFNKETGERSIIAPLSLRHFHIQLFVAFLPTTNNAAIFCFSSAKNHIFFGASAFTILFGYFVWI